VEAAQLSMKPLTDHRPVPHKHSPNKRIRTHLPAPTFGQLQGSLQV